MTKPAKPQPRKFVDSAAQKKAAHRLFLRALGGLSRKAQSKDTR